MSFDVTIAIPTCGEQSWSDLAIERALPSAQTQDVPVLHVHYRDATVSEARNRILGAIGTEWVVYLDADDELEPDFVAHIAKGTCDLRAPAVRYQTPGWPLMKERMPRVSGHQHACSAECLPYGNWLVVGSAVRTQLIHDAGGWREWPCFEDWCLWVRCWQLGATVEAVPHAVYRAHVRHDSRNRSGAAEERLETHRAIARDLGLPVP